MTKTVDDVRNEIRVGVGRHERLVSTAFTKEALAAICDAVGDPVATGVGSGGGLPSKPEMRARIPAAIGEREPVQPSEMHTAFRKAELVAIRDALELAGDE
jgi:hypothetical protein